MTKWEYDRVRIQDDRSLDAVLHEQGAQGWEVIKMRFHDSLLIDVYFKRPLEDSPTTAETKPKWHKTEIDGYYYPAEQTNAYTKDGFQRFKPRAENLLRKNHYDKISTVASITDLATDIAWEIDAAVKEALAERNG